MPNCGYYDNSKNHGHQFHGHQLLKVLASQSKLPCQNCEKKDLGVAIASTLSTLSNPDPNPRKDI